MRRVIAIFLALMTMLVAVLGSPAIAEDDYAFNDTHFRLTNYVQKGPPPERRCGPGPSQT